MESGSILGRPSSMEDNRGRSSMDDERKTIEFSSRNTVNHKGRECCMCGDIGFQESLFSCHRCHYRFQHIYCSRLYPHQLELDSVNVCDWCLDLRARQKIQSHKRKVELQEMQRGKAKTVAVRSATFSMSASASAMKQPASVAIANPRKANAKPGSLNLRVKSGGRKQNQPLSLTDDCKLSSESCRNVPHTPRQRNTSKGGLSRRYKLLSDVLCS